ncbi:hypothetical protein PJI17_32565, partial [Mycobacterium kansasii]
SPLIITRKGAFGKKKKTPTKIGMAWSSRNVVHPSRWGHISILVYVLYIHAIGPYLQVMLQQDFKK